MKVIQGRSCEQNLYIYLSIEQISSPVDILDLAYYCCYIIYFRIFVKASLLKYRYSLCAIRWIWPRKFCNNYVIIDLKQIRNVWALL
jgi:hypothetical protein